MEWFTAHYSPPLPEVNGRHGVALTLEKLQDSELLSSRQLPSSGPSPVVKLPSELLPFFRMSGSLGSSHSMVGPAMGGEHAGGRFTRAVVLPQGFTCTCTHTHTRTATLTFSKLNPHNRSQLDRWLFPKQQPEIQESVT